MSPVRSRYVAPSFKQKALIRQGFLLFRRGPKPGPGGCVLLATIRIEPRPRFEHPGKPDGRRIARHFEGEGLGLEKVIGGVENRFVRQHDWYPGWSFMMREAGARGRADGLRSDVFEG